MALPTTYRLSPTAQALLDAARARYAATQAAAAARAASVQAGIQLPSAAQRAAQASATIQAATTAGTAAAAQVKASGGTVVEQRAAAVTAGVQAATKSVATQTQTQVDAVQAKMDAQREKNKSEWWYTAPWYRVWDPTGTRVPNFDHDIHLVNWLLGYVKKNGADSFPEPPTAGVPFKPTRAHEVWWELMIRIYGGDKYPPPPPGSSLVPEWKDAYARATHPGGTFGAIASGIKQVVSKLGNILITIVGAALAPFTGGASVLAATILVSANSVRKAAVAAASASRTNSRAAAAQQAEAQRQAAALQKQVDDFFQNNQAWFAQHGVTPAAWAKLTLDQKVELIRAGSAGQLPVTPASNPLHDALQGGASGSTASASGAPAVTASATPGSFSAPTVSWSVASDAAAPNVTGAFRLDVEGRTVATAGSSQEISADASSMAKVGDRFEIFQDGQSLGLKIRTADGAISIPADKAAQVRAMSHEDVLKLLGTAAASAGASSGSGGGLLLLLALPAVAFVATKK